MTTRSSEPQRPSEHGVRFMNPDLASFDAGNLIRHQVDANRRVKRLVGRHRASEEEEVPK